MRSKIVVPVDNAVRERDAKQREAVAAYSAYQAVACKLNEAQQRLMVLLQEKP